MLQVRRIRRNSFQESSSKSSQSEWGDGCLGVLSSPMFLASKHLVIAVRKKL